MPHRGSLSRVTVSRWPFRGTVTFLASTGIGAKGGCRFRAVSGRRRGWKLIIPKKRPSSYDSVRGKSRIHSILSSRGRIPSGATAYPKRATSGTPMIDSAIRAVRPGVREMLEIPCKRSRCSSPSSKVIGILSRYAIEEGRSFRIRSANGRKVRADFRSPNGIPVNAESPNRVITAVFTMCFSYTGILYMFLPSRISKELR